MRRGSDSGSVGGTAVAALLLLLGWVLVAPPPVVAASLGGIGGTVTDAVTKAPIEEVEVCAFETGWEEDFGCAYTDGEGRYEIAGLRAGTYKVGFYGGYVCDAGGCTARNYAIQFYDGKTSWQTANLVDVTAGATTTGIDAAMQEGGVIGGTVTDAVTKAPIEEVEVCAIETAGEEFGGCAYTDGEGRYEIAGLNTGTYKVIFYPFFVCDWFGCTSQYEPQFYDGKSSWQTADPVAVTAGATTAGIDAAMVPTQAASSGPGGSPSANPLLAHPVPAPSVSGSGTAVSGAAAIVKGGRAFVPLRCPGSDPCSGLVKLTTVSQSRATKRRSRNSRARRRGRAKVLGRSRFSIPAGRRRLVPVRLNRRGRAMLRHTAPRAVRVRLAGRGVKPRALLLKERGGRRQRR